MAKITAEDRELYSKKIIPYAGRINQIVATEQTVLMTIQTDSEGAAYRKLSLCDLMMQVTTQYIMMNNLSVQFLAVKNNTVLNEARKTLYKAVIYLEEVVTNFIDVPYSDLDDKLAAISDTPLVDRYYLIRKLGLTIQMLFVAFGDNTKWKWSFVELDGRFAVVAKNLLDMKEAAKVYFDPSYDDYNITVSYIRLIKKLLDKSASAYRDKYELSSRRIDDMRAGINFILALRRLDLAISDSDEAEDLKKKAAVWKEKMESDHKAGVNN